MFKRLNKLIRDKRGQGMTEYIIIVTVVAVSAIGIFTIFGKSIRSVATQIIGQTGGDEGAKAKNYTLEAEGQRDKHVTLDNPDNEW